MSGPTILRCLAAALAFQLILGVAASDAPVPAVSATPDYKIHPGDQLAISVYGEPTLTQNATVLADGTIEYPLIGRIKVGGQTPSDAANTLNHALTKYLRKPIVSVAVTTQGDITVMVLGNVKTPGKYTVPFDSRVTDAIAVAGGMGPTNGDYPTARITDPGSVRDASLQEIFRRGVVAADITLNNNSVVYVPSPVAFNVEVVGAVATPGEISINQGDRLSAAIAKAGASGKSSADLNAIRVTRNLGNGQTKVYNVNLYQELEKGDMSADLELQKNDVIFVPEAKKGGGAVTDTIFGLLGGLLRF